MGGKLIRRARRAADLTQQQVADASGISRPYLSQIETGRRQPPPATLAALLKALENLGA